MSNGGDRGIRFGKVAETEEGRESLIDGGNLSGREAAEDALDAALVDGSQLVDQSEGPLGEAARAGSKGRIKESLAGRAGQGHYAEERETLVGGDIGIAHHDAGPHAALFAADGRVEGNDHYGAAGDLHAGLSTQPWPGTQ
jgi:hypothetical protein